MTKQDWTLLVIDASKQGGLTPVQLQKALFLFGQRVPHAAETGFYEFVPYNYGPFSQEIYNDAEILQQQGLVSIVFPLGQRWPEYAITSRGEQRASEVRRETSTDVVAYLETLVGWVKSQTFQDLLRAVYQEYPEFAVNSVFRG